MYDSGISQAFLWLPCGENLPQKKNTGGMDLGLWKIN